MGLARFSRARGPAQHRREGGEDSPFPGRQREKIFRFIKGGETMKGRWFIIGFMLLGIILIFPPADSFAKPIKVLAQFPMSGPVGSLPEFGWGFIDGMNYINAKGGVNGKPIT